jgi:hypothetical protein
MLKFESRIKYFLSGILKIITLIILAVGIIHAGTTGKLKGKITDASDGEPLIGANVIIEGTYMGAAANMDGEYVINNIPPGEYTVIYKRCRLPENNRSKSFNKNRPYHKC